MRCEMFAVWMVRALLATCVCLGIASQFLAKVSPLKLALLAAFNIEI